MVIALWKVNKVVWTSTDIVVWFHMKVLLYCYYYIYVSIHANPQTTISWDPFTMQHHMQGAAGRSTPMQIRPTQTAALLNSYTCASLSQMKTELSILIGNTSQGAVWNSLRLWFTFLTNTFLKSLQ